MNKLTGKQSTIFKAASADIKDNRIRAIASSVGNMDRGGCVICPGAYSKSVLKDFTDNGSILVGHGWDDLPVAFPVSAGMEGDQLVCEAEFHTTERGQEARTVCVERMDAGKSVSVSVGFMPDYKSEGGVKFFESGADMVDWLESAGYDLAQFDTKTIKAKKGWCYAITKIAELFEWSIVMVGMNPRAKATMAKSDDFEPEGDRDAPLAQHLDAVRGTVRGLVDRLAALQELRASEGKAISPDRLPAMKQLHADLGRLIELAEPKPEQEDDRQARFKALARRARSLTHAA